MMLQQDTKYRNTVYVYTSSGLWQLKHFLFSPRTLGEMIQFDEHIFQRGWFNHQLVFQYLITDPWDCVYLATPLKIIMSPISKRNASSNHWFSGDMLVFRGVHGWCKCRYSKYTIYMVPMGMGFLAISHLSSIRSLKSLAVSLNYAGGGLLGWWACSPYVSLHTIR